MNSDRLIANLATDFCSRCYHFGHHWTDRRGTWPCPILDHLQTLSRKEQPLPAPLCSSFVQRYPTLPTLACSPDPPTLL